MSKTIVSYNVNGVRSAMNKGFAEWMQIGGYDVVCLQEIKANPDQVDTAFLTEMGYHHHWFPAEKKGYSGVATFSKQAPDQVILGCGIEKYDREGRILRTDFGDWSVLNCYFPSGTTGDERQSFKMTFLDDFFLWAQELAKTRSRLIIVGDYNIAHTEKDIHDPKGNKNSSGFLPEEREWMTKWFNSGFTDAFRFANPDKIEYSWWSFRANARANNKGWRIDYQSVTDNLQDKILEAGHSNDAVHSDHCPVWLKIDL
jgi:exodeoxyribonuclease III